MSGKDFLVMALLLVVSVWGVEFLISRFSGKKAETTEEIQSGQSYIAPKSKQEVKPLNVAVNFVETACVAPATKTEVDTPTIHAVFSTDGASLELLEFKRGAGDARRITTIKQCAQEVRETRCFLVGLENESPFNYSLIDSHNDASATTLTYQATCPDGIVRKTFIVSHDKYQIDMDLTLVPAAGKSMVARVFYPTPSIGDAKDPKSLVVSAVGGSIKKIARSSVDEQMGWYEPTLFGSDDRYFVHALVNDEKHFVQRAYPKILGQDDFLSVLEGPEVKEEATYKLSYYFGPKETAAMNMVDARLVKTLDYSALLAPLYRLFMAILLFLFYYLKNYGLAIIVFTILIKFAMLPFTLRSERGMKKHAELQKKLDYLKQRYKNEPQVLAQEQSELIRHYGMPGLFGSCLPILIQFPILIIVMRLLSTSVELYQAPFLWVKDISAIDPWYILPALVVLFMVLQALLGESKSRVQGLVIALVVGALSASFSVGVCLYWLTSTIFSVAQVAIQKRLKAA